MEYVVGSVAALITGNVTPSRPKHLKRALTPTKHQPSPNVTPKSEYVEDRSRFLSPSLQKKKAIVKKSPKRIFQNTDLDVSNDGESNTSSPKTDKVKKHLKDDLDFDSVSSNIALSSKSPKNALTASSEKLKQEIDPEVCYEHKKEKRKRNTFIESEECTEKKESDKSCKKRKKNKLNLEAECDNTTGTKNRNLDMEGKSNVKEKSLDNLETNQSDPTVSKKKKKKNKLTQNIDIDKSNVIKNSNIESNDSVISETSQNNPPIKKKKDKSNKENKSLDSSDFKEKPKKKRKKDMSDIDTNHCTDQPMNELKEKKKSKCKSKESYAVNPNAITNKDTDSEHESDDEMTSENEEVDKKALEADKPESSDDENEQTEKSVIEKVHKKATVDEIKRTLFVGNVPLSKKCKKEIKKIFSEYGRIETVRIRTVPVKDARVTPKVAVIKNELHPDRSTVNIYIRYAEADSVDKALSANNMVLNDHHLRVTRSDVIGAYHDLKCSIFVGNLPFALEDEVLRAKFEKCGEIHSVRIIRDKKTNAGKGFGYVNFTSKDGVELALALTDEDLTIKNRILRVKRCTLTNKKPVQGRPGRPDNLDRHSGQVWNNNGRHNQSLKNEGACRRIMNKRKNTDGRGGPPSKRQRELNQPHKEKKTRKEFVGMTAEKKKKQKFNKGQKKKKALSEILTKK